ncbi:MAG: hypothetical protein QNI84_04580 [Henriciella sp.]|nr:hypothetical protein [Henriciella sp.]
MTVTWPQNAKLRFGKHILEATHDLGSLPVFSDDGLAALLDAYPRESLGVWTFGTHGEGEAPAIRGRADDLSGAEIMDAVRRGQIWLNLREANLKLPKLQPIASEIFGSLEAAAFRKLRKQDMGLLISSPHVHVHYHLDIPLVALLQLRGEKRIWLYPAEESFAPSSMIEDMVHMRKEEGLHFEAQFDEHAAVVDLKPGMGLTWPQMAPHRVQNADCVNVSLSCEYMTVGALIEANAIYTDRFTRTHFRQSPERAATPLPVKAGKAALARAIKAVHRTARPTSPTAITFEVDPLQQNCIRLL